MEFSIPVMIHLLVFISLYVIKCIPYEIISNLSSIVLTVFAIYSFITLFPLSFRRLHDEGHKAVKSNSIDCLFSIFINIYFIFNDFSF